MENIRDTWSTPQDLRVAITGAYGYPQLDVCADSGNRFGVEFFGLDHHLIASRDGLTASWECRRGYAWCNPPGSQVGEWIAKAHAEQKLNRYSLLLVQAGLETKWFTSIRDVVETRILRGRVQFDPPAGIARSSNSRNYMLLDFDPKYLYHPMQRISVWDWEETQ